MERSLKMFIKTACCFPERITKKDYDSILTELKDSEKVSAYFLIVAPNLNFKFLSAPFCGVSATAIYSRFHNIVFFSFLVAVQVHVNLMILEARNQAELLYALREIMRYMTWYLFEFLLIAVWMSFKFKAKMIRK